MPSREAGRSDGVLGHPFIPASRDGGKAAAIGGTGTEEPPGPECVSSFVDLQGARGRQPFFPLLLCRVSALVRAPGNRYSLQWDVKRALGRRRCAATTECRDSCRFLGRDD